MRSGGYESGTSHVGRDMRCERKRGREGEEKLSLSGEKHAGNDHGFNLQREECTTTNVHVNGRETMDKEKKTKSNLFSNTGFDPSFPTLCGSQVVTP